MARALRRLTPAMKTTKQTATKLGTAAAILGLAAFTLTPTAFGDDEIEKVKVKDNKVKVKGEDGKVKIKDNGKVKIKGDADEELAVAREAMSAEQQAEFKASLAEGYTIPTDQYVYLDPVPETYMTRLDPAPEGYVYRWYDNTVYTVDPNTYTIISVQTFE